MKPRRRRWLPLLKGKKCAGAVLHWRTPMAIAPHPSRQRRMTEDEFMRLPDDGRKYELVDGEPKEVPTSVTHDVIGSELIFRLRPYVKGRGFLTIGQAGFRMTSHNIRCPDVSFMRKERLPDGKPNEGFGDAAPDLCVEIISPSEERADMERKVREYFASGAEQVWHLFPERQRLVRFRSPGDSDTLEADDVIEGGDLLPGFSARIGDLFDLE
jgi:Uma2 family endonuclease